MTDSPRGPHRLGGAPRFCRPRAVLRLAPLFLLLCGASRVTAADSEAQTLAEFLMTGLRDQRERLRQGLVRGTGAMVQAFKVGPIEGPIRFMYAFDFDRDLLHVERDDPRRTVQANGLGGDLAAIAESESRIETWHYAYIHKPDRTISFLHLADSPNPGQIQIGRADLRPSRQGVFDIRAVGLLVAFSYQEKPTIAWSEIYDIYGNQPADEVVDEGDGIFRIRWTAQKNTYRYFLWIDRKKGFSPIRLERQSKFVNIVRGSPDKWPPPYETCEATWTEINGVWVPATFRIEDRQYKDAEGRVTTFEHELHWELVNQPVPDELFEVDSFQAPEGTTVTDHRGQDIVLVRVIGLPHAREVGTVYTKPTPGHPGHILRRGPPPVARPGPPRRVLLLLNLGVVLMVIVWLLYLRRKSRARPT